MQSAGILGTGLIGASIGQALTVAGWEVFGWDPDPAALERASELGSVTAVSDAAALLGSNVDLLVLAGPPEVVIRSVSEIEIDCLVMDVTGVKGPVVERARPARFVGTHPMAGRESSGPDAASPALFRGAAWVVVTDGADYDDVVAAEEVVTLLGARPLRMTAAEHDEAVAVISHLPQLLASSLLLEAMSREGASDVAAGSFRDLTRVAASDPVSWTQLLFANKTAVIGAVEDLRERLAGVARHLTAGDVDAMREMLEQAQVLRRDLAPPVMAVRVALEDSPGELARVGRALERSGVDVRDLQLRHAPFGGGGLLTLSVRPGEAEALREAIVDEELLLAE